MQATLGRLAKLIDHPETGVEFTLDLQGSPFELKVWQALSEIPAGTKMEVIAHYDNSANNKANPDPSKEVKWGDQTWEEMMIGFWSSVAERPVVTPTQPPR